MITNQNGFNLSLILRLLKVNLRGKLNPKRAINVCYD